MGRLEAALADWETVTARTRGARLQVDDWCGYCFGPQDLEALSGPPHLVREDLLSSIAAKEPGHWGDAFPALYRRFAPRIVAELVHNRLHVDEALIASRLVQAGWQDWPEDERRALERVMDAWWEQTLAVHPCEPAPWRALEFLTVATAIITPWLRVWAGTCGDAADRHLRDLCSYWLPDLFAENLGLGFYELIEVAPGVTAWIFEHAPGRIDRWDDEGKVTRDLAQLESHLRGQALRVPGHAETASTSGDALAVSLHLPGLPVSS